MPRDGRRHRAGWASHAPGCSCAKCESKAKVDRARAERRQRERLLRQIGGGQQLRATAHRQPARVRLAPIGAVAPNPLLTGGGGAEASLPGIADATAYNVLVPHGADRTVSSAKKLPFQSTGCALAAPNHGLLHPPLDNPERRAQLHTRVSFSVPPKVQQFRSTTRPSGAVGDGGDPYMLGGCCVIGYGSSSEVARLPRLHVPSIVTGIQVPRTKKLPTVGAWRRAYNLDGCVPTCTRLQYRMQRLESRLMEGQALLASIKLGSTADC